MRDIIIFVSLSGAIGAFVVGVRIAYRIGYADGCKRGGGDR